MWKCKKVEYVCNGIDVLTGYGEEERNQVVIKESVVKKG